MNIKFKANLRILDFSPHNLEDFTFRFKIPEKTPLSDDEDDDPDSGSDISSGAKTPPPPSSAADREDREWKWEWQFYLLCEDIKPTRPKERIKLCITKEDAVFLLGLDACNLRKNPRIVSQLREKLFILWGDLEERKRHAQSLGLTIWHPPEAFKEMNERKGIKNGWGEWNRPKSKPFNCCIAEYGKKNKNNKEALGGWERRFRMFGTTIS
jgi:protection-of-telomeres protein 1